MSGPLSTTMLRTKSLPDNLFAALVAIQFAASMASEQGSPQGIRIVGELIAVLKEFGVTDYLAAPVTQDSLLARIEEKLRRAG